jgi:hypothetical protein
MPYDQLRPRRAALPLLAAGGLAAGALLSGCGATATHAVGSPAGGASAARVAPAADTAGSDLSSLLLTSGQLGPGATVTQVPAAKLQQARSMAGALSGALGAVQVTPSSCADALQAVLPQLAAVQDAAAEYATSGGQVTGELIAVPGAGTDALGQFRSAVSACSSAQVASGQFGSATITLTPVTDGVPADAAAVAVAVTGQRSGDGSFSGTGLLGLGTADGRVLALAQGDPHGGSTVAPPDASAFTALLSQALVDAHG